MNILHLNLTDLTGRRFNGFDLHIRQRELGHDACLIVNRKESDDVTTFVYNDDTVVRGVDVPVNYGYAVVKQLMSCSQFLDADIIHINIAYNVLFDLQYLPLITTLKPVVWSLHDLWLLCGRCIHPGDCEKWTTHCYDCKFSKGRFSIDGDDPALFLENKRIAIQSSQIEFTGASKWLTDRMRRSPMLAGKQIHHVPFGIDQKVFQPGNSRQARVELGIDDEDIVFFARQQRVFKRQDIIRSALPKLGISDKPITLLLVGEMGEFDPGVENVSVRQFGWVKDDELMVKLYQACDLLLMPSDQESFGLLAVEAMSCGKMVLALECPGSAVPEVIDAPNCGLAATEEQYGDELRRLLHSPGEVRMRGEQSLAYARKHYDRDTYVQQLFDVYGQVRERFVLSDRARLILEQLRKQGAPSIEELANPEQLVPRRMLYVVKKI